MAFILLACVLVVAFWEIMSNRSRRPHEAFQLTASDFAGFAPQSRDWRVELLPVKPESIEPNILAYRVARAVSGSAPVLVRLVHGYNMPDCMHIKGYAVALLHDTRRSLQERADAALAEGGAAHCRPYQVWRLTSGTGDASIWVTSMLRVGDFAATHVDVRSMAFPRVGVPDDPNWLPQGLTRRSLRHPVANFRKFIRARWNSSRSDLATFLGLRQPAWASRDLLTLVAVSGGPPVRDGGLEAVTADVVAVHGFMESELRAWRQTLLDSHQP